MTFSRIISDLKTLNSFISKINHPPPSAMSTLYNYTAAVEGGGGWGPVALICAHIRLRIMLPDIIKIG